MSAFQETRSGRGLWIPAPPWRRRQDRWRVATLQQWQMLLEGSVVLLAGTVVGLNLPVPLGAIPPDWVMLASGVTAVVASSVSSVRRILRPAPPALARRIVIAVALGSATLSLIGVPWRTTLAWAIGDTVVAGSLLVCLAVLYKGWLQDLVADGRLATHVAVVGAGPIACRVETRLTAAQSPLYRVVGRYTSHPPDAGVRGGLRTLLCDCRLGIVDAVILAPEPDDAAGQAELRAVLRPCIQDIYLAAELIGHAPEAAPVFAFGTTPVLLVSRRPIAGWPAVGKRILDRGGALLLIAMLMPLLLLIATAIRLDTRGPVLFRQLRVGYNNQLFHIYKFRSMRADATDRLAKQQTTVGDKRVTRVGAVIRRLSLDELPQLLNVLRGDMSLVGPRPHAPGTSVGGQRLHKLVPDYTCRHLVRPGITGLAQVRGLRGGLQHLQQVEDRLTADLEYIENWSFWLDVKILFLTIFKELRGSNAC